MLKFILLVVLGVIVLASGLAISCGGQATPTPTPSPTPSATATGGTTVGQLAAAGQTVFANNCARCHGDQGQGITGPRLIGNGNTLDKYVTAQGLLDFIDSSMPLNAPGSLSHQDYLNVLSYLLVQDNFVGSSTAFNESGLAQMQLK
jgi:mono/diheme cytochrome c family protein